MEASEQRLQNVKHAASDCCADLKEELQQVKQTLDNVVCELWKMRVQPVEPMPARTTEVDKKNM